MEAIAHAVSGAMRDMGFVTPGPRKMVFVLTALRASAAYTSLVNICES